MVVAVLAAVEASVALAVAVSAAAEQAEVGSFYHKTFKTMQNYIDNRMRHGKRLAAGKQQLDSLREWRIVLRFTAAAGSATYR